MVCIALMSRLLHCPLRKSLIAIKQNPVTAAMHFHYRSNVFFQSFAKSTVHPLGEMVNFAIRIQFQLKNQNTIPSQEVFHMHSG